MRSGRYRLLYVSPERLVGEGSDGFLALLAACNVQFVAIDEAHCISQWGHDFRPEYRQLGRLRQLLPGVSVHAYTATATARVRQDITAQLALEQSRRARRIVRSAEPCIPDPGARHAQTPAARCPRAPPARSRHRLLHVAQGSGRARRVAHGNRYEGPALPCRLVRRRAQPEPGCFPQRARRRDRGDSGVRHGDRPIRCPLRRARRSAAIARTLSAGVGAGGAGRPRGRVPADHVERRLHEMARDARTQQRAHRSESTAAPADGALFNGRRLPPSPSVGVLR